MSERKVFDYRDAEEARQFIGKPGLFSDFHWELSAKGVGFPGVLEAIRPNDDENEGDLFESSARGTSYAFFSPDPEPIVEYVPFTAADHELFAGKWVRAKDKTPPCGSMITDFGRDAFRAAQIETKYADALDTLVFLDGSPFGKRVVK